MFSTKSLRQCVLWGSFSLITQFTPLENVDHRIRMDYNQLISKFVRNQWGKVFYEVAFPLLHNSPLWSVFEQYCIIFLTVIWSVFDQSKVPYFFLLLSSWDIHSFKSLNLVFFFSRSGNCVFYLPGKVHTPFIQN